MGAVSRESGSVEREEEFANNISNKECPTICKTITQPSDAQHRRNPKKTGIALWERGDASRLLRARPALDHILTGERLDLATLSVVSRQLRGLAR